MPQTKLNKLLKPQALFLIILIGLFLKVNGQQVPEKGVPLLRNFMPAEYQNKGKVWDIHTAKDGMVYLAADKGLLEYDGKTWNSYKGSNGFTRSLLVANDSTIYTGSDLDFGVWKKNKFQQFEYSSLYPFQKEKNEEFWDIYQLNEGILFVSFDNIYLYTNQQLTILPAPNRFTGSFLVDDKIYFSDQKAGLLELREFKLIPVFPLSNDHKFEIAGLYQQNEDLIIVTKYSGLFKSNNGNLTPIKSELSEKLSSAKVFSFSKINKTHLAFGTVLKGLYITDLNGKVIHHINKNKGLLNNTILCLHYSKLGKLWLGLDYGITSVDLENSYTLVNDFRGDFGTGYTAILKDNNFYLGTNQGLYHTNWNNLNNNTEYYNFQLITGSEGQVWTLKEIENTLFVGHDRGLFMLENNAVKSLSHDRGTWTITQYKNYLLAGNYNGISIYERSENTWRFKKKMELILGSCNQVIVEKDNILWVNIPNFGIIRARLDAELNPTDRLIIPESDFEGDNTFLVKTDSGIHLNTSKFQYTFLDSENKFEKKQEMHHLPQVNGLLPGIFPNVPLNDAYAFYPAFNGFALKFSGENNQTLSGNKSLILRRMQGMNNDKKSDFYPSASIPHKLNNIKLEYIVPNQEGVLYQYKLNNSSDWSDLTTNNSFEFLGLKYGKYTFQIRALINNEYTETSTLEFRINAPWYRNRYAYAVYFVLFCLLLFLMNKLHNLQLKKQRKKMLQKEQQSLRDQAEKHRLQVIALEQELLQKEYDELKQQLKNKTVELANKAKDNEEKNRLLLTLKEKFESFQTDPVHAKIRQNEIKRLLDAYLNVEDKTFEIQMDELHQEFFKKLKERFPTLSTNDLRWCAYLKIGLNSKEIADILNIQQSSAFISRSRLRKKLNLKAEDDLHDFLNTI